MQISPLNRSNMRHRQLNIEREVARGERSPGKAKVEEVTMYRCPVCLDLHEWESDAEECCEENLTTEGAVATDCPVCGEQYNSHRDAADCCLWKDIDALTRWRIADAVESGKSWQEAIHEAGA